MKKTILGLDLGTKKRRDTILSPPESNSQLILDILKHQNVF
jgi:hypothetical protein